MYRTYRELYRQKTEITTIGEGAGAVKFGKYLSVGLDIVLLGAISGIVIGFPLGGILHHIYSRIPTFVWALAIGVLSGWLAKQFDPQGKTVLEWAADVIMYLRRKRITDGYKPVLLIKNPIIHRFAFFAVDQGTARATPVEGKGAFTLHKPLGAKVLKDGSWVLKRSKHPLEPGKYKVVDGKIKHANAAPIPKLHKR